MAGIYSGLSHSFGSFDPQQERSQMATQQALAELRQRSSTETTTTWGNSFIACDPSSDLHIRDDKYEPEKLGNPKYKNINKIKKGRSKCLATKRLFD